MTSMTSWVYAMNGGPQVLLSADAARELGMPLSHLEQMLSKGAIQGHQEIGEGWTVDRVEVDRVLRERATDRSDRAEAEATADARRSARAARNAGLTGTG